jgi:hypothetical protein
MKRKLNRLAQLLHTLRLQIREEAITCSPIPSRTSCRIRRDMLKRISARLNSKCTVNAPFPEVKRFPWSCS